MENKRKHLDFLQLIITRMNVNSFLLKGWAVTLVAALFAFAAKDANNKYVFITYISTIVFWVLDGYYLSLERQYRDLYNEIRKKTEDEIDFDLNAKRFDTGSSTWMRSLFSHTLLIFYGILLLIPIIIYYAFK